MVKNFFGFHLILSNSVPYRSLPSQAQTSSYAIDVKLLIYVISLNGTTVATRLFLYLFVLAIQQRI